MSTITPTTPDNGGTLRFLYTDGDPKGVCSNTPIVVTIAINPSDIIPYVILRLQLEPGKFLFDNKTLIATKDCGKLEDGDEIKYTFTLICTDTDPGDILRLRVYTRDEAEPDAQERFTSVQYTVEKVMTTAKRVKAAFLR